MFVRILAISLEILVAISGTKGLFASMPHPSRHKSQIATSMVPSSKAAYCPASNLS